MITLSINDDALQAALGRLAAGIADLSPVMNDIGAFLVRSAKDRAARGVTPDGAPFAPRSPVTIAEYQRRGLSYGGVLHRSGDMLADLFHSYGPDHVAVGSNAIQSAVMQFGQPKGASGTTSRGGPIPWGDIPARPFLGVSAEDRVGIDEILAE